MLKNITYTFLNISDSQASTNKVLALPTMYVYIVYVCTCMWYSIFQENKKWCNICV